MKFSERYRHDPISESLQIDSMDEGLKTGLWNIFVRECWNYENHSKTCNAIREQLGADIWRYHLELPIDQKSEYTQDIFDHIREYFHNADWYKIYDFIEFVANNYLQGNQIDDLSSRFNKVLEEKASAYRFVGGLITKITDEEEIETIETAMNNTSDAISTHLKRSLELLSDKSTPDYRNSIKESISAVESLVAFHTNSDKGTLGQLLDELKKQNDLHPSLIEAFKKLYGYSSDEDGIRHGIIDKSNVDFYDAKFMLVACSAFVSFVNGKNQ